MTIHVPVKINESVMDRVAVALGAGVDKVSIVEMLSREGIIGYDAWLAYQAGRMLMEARESQP